MSDSQTSDHSVQTALKRIDEARVPLARASDRLTRTLEAIEETLREFKTGVEVWLDDAALESGSTEYCRIPGFAKIDGRFGFGVAAGVDGDPAEEWRLTSLAQISRDDKLAIVERLPLLVERMAAAVERKVCSVEEATHTAGRFLDDLRAQRVKEIKPIPVE